MDSVPMQDRAIYQQFVEDRAICQPFVEDHATPSSKRYD